MIAFVVGVFMAMRESPGVAQPKTGDVPPRHVEVMMVAPNDSWPALETVLSELLARLQVSVRFSSLPSIDAHQIMSDKADDPPAVARVWIDMHEPARVTLYLAGDRDDRLLVRHVPLVTRLDEVAREEIAHIVEATVDALLVGGRIGVVTDEPRPAAKIDAVAPPKEHAPTGLALNLGIAYAAVGWSAAAPPLHTAALFLGVESRTGTFRPGLWLSGEYRFPTTIETDLVTARLDQGAFRGTAFVDWAASRRLLIGAGVGGGLDLVHISPEPGAKVAAATSYYATMPMLRAMGILRWAFASQNELFAGVAADYDLLGTRYLLHQSTQGDVLVLQPWRLRPMALIGVSTDVLAH